ncbi:MAG: hypothetical protein KatS3mg084_0239 [Candidatus Dojkabacteria bacterium]|nr:MAG: hypothetical protein KatS3mg084_0239 [Candidatus Dojkabacteria bacterium]
MVIKQISFCTFLIETRLAKILINPTTVLDGDVSIYSVRNSPYMEYKQRNSDSFVITGAGEFEIKEVFVNGRKNKHEDTYSYNIYIEDVAIGIISFINSIDHIPEELFENIDVLLIGVGAGPFLAARDANQVINKFSPAIAVCFGLREQARSDIKFALDSIEEVKKEISGVNIYHKPLQLDRSNLDTIEDTICCYFDL